MNLLREYVREILSESCGGNLEIKDSPIHGVGVFTSESIPANTNLGPAQIKRGGGYDVTELGKHHNHSETPSCYNAMENNVRYLYTSRNLEPGEEITIDYTLQPDLEQPQHDWK